ncbi:MAG: 50S ribosomal protein L7ae [Clostridiales bacterium]|nr:50S ribosomal protein L7ae [Clostridiales bacterium]
MNKNVLSLISLATKAGKTVTGEFSVESAVKDNKAVLVVVSADSSDRSKKMYKNMCEFYRVPLYFFGTKDELGHFTGKEFRASVAILDNGFKKSIVSALELLGSEEYSHGGN